MNREGQIVERLPVRVGGRPVALAFPRLVAPGEFLAVDRAGRRVVRFDRRGEVLWEYRGPAPFRPRYAESLPSGEVFILDEGTASVLAVAPDGGFLWRWSWSPGTIIRPWSLQPLSPDEFLMADCEMHHVIQVTRNGDVTWRFGRTADPGSREDQLCYPHSARRLPGGHTLIADALNRRVLEVDQTGGVVWSFRLPREGDWHSGRLEYPTWAERLPNSQTLIADRDSDRLLLASLEGRIVWESRPPEVRRRLFFGPRSIQVLASGHLLVADTLANRVIEVDVWGEVLWRYGDAGQGCRPGQLYWPRAAVRTADGLTWIADARNSRLLAVSRGGRTEGEITACVWGKVKHPFQDPHAITLLPSGRFLITDANAGFVAEVSPEGKTHWFFAGRDGERLADAHHACRTPTGETLICDTGHSRILSVGPSGEILWIRAAVDSGGRLTPLAGPRYVADLADGTMLILDNDNGRILWVDRSFRLLSRFQPDTPDLRHSLVDARWIELLPRGGAWVSDTAHHRLIRFEEWAPDSEDGAPDGV
jgi:outer membrane protein assembly factor BamB